jgi:hypothetical protein
VYTLPFLDLADDQFVLSGRLLRVVNSFHLEFQAIVGHAVRRLAAPKCLIRTTASHPARIVEQHFDQFGAMLRRGVGDARCPIIKAST